MGAAVSLVWTERPQDVVAAPALGVASELGGQDRCGQSRHTPRRSVKAAVVNMLSGGGQARSHRCSCARTPQAPARGRPTTPLGSQPAPRRGA